MVLVVAGNDALRTVKAATALSRFEGSAYVIGTGEAAPSRAPGRRPR
jgi:hypothetical protein